MGSSLAKMIEYASDVLRRGYAVVLYLEEGNAVEGNRIRGKGPGEASAFELELEHELGRRVWRLVGHDIFVWPRRWLDPMFGLDSKKARAHRHDRPSST